MPAIASLPPWALVTFVASVMIFVLTLLALVLFSRRAGIEVVIHLLPPKIEIRTGARAIEQVQDAAESPQGQPAEDQAAEPVK